MYVYMWCYLDDLLILNWIAEYPWNVCKFLFYFILPEQASLSEIHSNMWVRNGLQIKGQAMTYVQSHFCNSMIDPDIYLLQVSCFLRSQANSCLQTNELKNKINLFSFHRSVPLG